MGWRAGINVDLGASCLFPLVAVGRGKIASSLGGGTSAELELSTGRRFLTTPWHISCQTQEFDYFSLASTV